MPRTEMFLDFLDPIVGITTNQTVSLNINGKEQKKNH